MIQSLSVNNREVVTSASANPSLQDTFLQINDQINSVLNRYEAFTKGDYVTASNPIPAEIGPGAAGLSLIDLDESTSPPATTTNPAGPDDLAGLFTSSRPLTNPAIPPMAPVPLPTYNTPPLAPYNGAGNGSSMGMFMGGAPGLTRSGISPPRVSSTPPAIMLPGTPVRNAPSPNYFGTHANVAKGPVPVVGGIGRGPVPSSLGTQPQPLQPVTGGSSASGQVQGKDPFADLAGLF
jgi:ADP-ribosylation factor-binding protein GGA